MSAVSRRRLLGLSAAALAGGCGYVSSNSGRGLTMLTNHTNEEAAGFLHAIADFRRQHGGVQVNYLNIADGTHYYTKLKTASVAGNLPDVWFARTYDTAFNAANGWQRSMQDWLERDPSVEVKDFWPAELAQITYQGEVYSLPYDFSNFAVYYNKTMFRSAGVPAPNDDWTWTEFFELAAHFSRRSGGRQTRWGSAFPTQDWMFLGVLLAHGGRMFSADLRRCVVNSPENVETMRFFARQLANGNAPLPGATPAGVNPFSAGLVAMNVNGSWATQQTREEIGHRFEWDVVKLPKGTTGRRAISTAGGAWGVSTDSRHPELAWALAAFLAAPAQSRAFIATPLRGIPGLQSVAHAEDRAAAASRQPPANFDVFSRQMAQDAVASAYPVFWSEFDTIWVNRVAAIVTGADPADVLPRIQDETNAAASRYFS